MNRAVVCREYAMPDKLELDTNWPVPELGPGDVRVAVKAAGLNFPDVLIVQGKYQFKPELPFVPGGECAGVVAEIGPEVTRFKVGDEVIHMGISGAFTETLVVDQHALLPKPRTLSFEQAAGVAMTYFTSYHALVQRAAIRSGETLLVLGAAGGVGITAIELGKALGAKVIAAASTAEKLATCRQAGADEVINYAEESLKDRIKELTDGRGVDVVYDPVGGDYTEPALRGMAWNGRYLVIGFASGPIPSIPLNLNLLKGCSIVGVFYGRFMSEEPAVNEQNVADLWRMFEEGKLSPLINDIYPIEAFHQGYDAMMQRRARGKVIFRF